MCRNLGRSFSLILNGFVAEDLQHNTTQGLSANTDVSHFRKEKQGNTRKNAETQQMQCLSVREGRAPLGHCDAFRKGFSTGVGILPQGLLQR